MNFAPGVAVGDDVSAEFCRANGVRRLALFGSALRGELRPDSDIDLLVEFEPGRTPGLLRLAALELEFLLHAGDPTYPLPAAVSVPFSSCGRLD